ncbi:MAG: NFACT RNA binding domain-containing protein [Bacteroidota bacterium]
MDNRHTLMITNYYTLFHIAVELNQEFSGRRVDEIFTQYRGELILSFRETPAVILVGCEPADNYIYARKTFARARRNSTDLFSEVHGMMIEKISIHTTDRQIYIRLKDGYELIVQLFGSKANILFVDTNGLVTDLFLKKSDLKNTKHELSSQIQRPDIPESLHNSIVATYGDQLLATALKRIFPLFGPVLIRELLTRVDLNGEQPLADLLGNEIDLLLNGAQRLKEELLSPPSPRVYSNGTSPVHFSIIPLQHLNEFEFQKYASVSEAISTFRAQVRHEKTILHEKEEIIKVLEREQEHMERTLQKIAAEAKVSSRAALYEKFGKLLIAQLHLIKKGDTTALAEDFVDRTTDLIEIPLDPHLTPAKNAERYFEKAVKSRHAAEEQHQRAAELTGQQKSINRLLTRMEDVITEDDLHRFAEENRKELSKFGLKTKKSGQLKKEEPLPFRLFTVAGGFQVWAGKSGENNDLLSTRHTAKNDLWFHARGVGGSHVVLKVGTGKGEVSKQAIEQAAAIAAYYSKMKKSKLVPVAMCEGKYVRKPKGVPAGTVTLEREKILFVEPALPQP